MDPSSLPIFFKQSLLHLPKFNLKDLAKRIPPSVTLRDTFLRRTPATPLTNAIPSATSSTTTTTTTTPQPQIGVQMNIRTLTPVEVEQEEKPYPSNMLITPSTTRKKGGTSKLQIDEPILEKRDLKSYTRFRRRGSMAATNIGGMMCLALRKRLEQWCCPPAAPPSSPCSSPAW